MALQCLIVDDSPGFLVAASQLLERQGLPVIGCVSTRSEALALTRELQPDVILVDVVLGRDSGFDLARDLAAIGTDATVILMSIDVEPDFGDMVAESQAAGFIPKAALSAGAIRQLAGEG